VLYFILQYQWHLRRHVHQIYKLSLVQLMVTFYGKEDKKLHIRRVVLMYQGQEEISEEIIPLLRQSDFYWIMKMGYLKINAALISALIERWRSETHMFHMRC